LGAVCVEVKYSSHVSLVWL